ncbi:MAG TPA: NAD(P)-dependent oxidoreductase [Elusimicrobiota bacterium]|nr:NAD(P)-dependent oxidoreductase [Elusimicrobiota bacterium]
MTDELKGKKILLIGGAGFIGHNMALTFSQWGAEVHIVDGLQVNNLLWFSSQDNDSEHKDLYMRFIQERLDLLRKARIPLYVQDVRDYHALCRIMSQIRPQIVIHLAAVAHAGRSNKDPYSTFDHSLRTLENALDASRGIVEHFVYFSSSMAYGNFLTPEVDEDQPLNPIGIYGALKVAGEKIVIAYQQVFDIPYTIVRPSALYGPRCVSRRVGQIFIENALQGKPLRMEGDGKERLDFTHIDDLVEGIRVILTNPNSRNQTFNVTYGQSRSINELAGIVTQHFPGSKIENVARDKLMPFRGTLSIKKAQKLLGYAPQNPIEVGFSKYIAWYKDIHKG